MSATRTAQEQHWTQPRDDDDAETCPECGMSPSLDCPRCDGYGYLLQADGDALADEAGDKEYDRRGDR